MPLLDGKKLLITGVLTDDSLAFGVAQLAQREGAEIALTGYRCGSCTPAVWPGKQVFLSAGRNHTRQGLGLAS